MGEKSSSKLRPTDLVHCRDCGKPIRRGDAKNNQRCGFCAACHTPKQKQTTNNR